MLLLIWILASILSGSFISFILFIRKLNALKKRLYTDKLTGLKNTNFFDDFFEKFLCPNTSYILIDIDNFKDFNSKIGYEATDKLLTHFVQVINEEIQLHDELLRYKFGDEFLIILKNQTTHTALLFVKRLRNKLNTDLLAKDEKPLSIYFSSGITSYKAASTKSTIIFELMNSLNKAKENKNMDVVYS